MLIGAIVLFLLAAVFGLVLLTAVLQDRVPNSKALVFHGSFAVVAVALMISYYVMYGGSPLLTASLTLFILAALGGLTLFLLGRKQKPVPKWVVLVHPLIALAGVITLLMYILP